ncbi:redoxin domain-containing protein [Candidatus Poribacteria bacterium]|nr:redoxin domain-containing protein [Candidatus Poribacteria bacterium]
MILKSKILPLALLAIIFLSCKNGGQEPKVGNPAPSLSLSDLNGNTVKLESLRGKVVILNFWSYT